MKQSKRQARDRNRQARKQAPEAAPEKGRASCPSCRAPLVADARFCHRCGVSLGGAAAVGRRHGPTLVLYGVIGLAVLVAAVGVVFMGTDNRPVAPAVSRAPASAPGQSQSVDLSTMTPREAADRLFNRVIMASEQGNTEEAQRFAPKAIQAYEQVARLDADAHYHMGLIYSVMGDMEGVRNQISIIKQYTPNHLLGLILEHEVAEKEGNSFGAARAAEAFAEAYDAEIRANRPEYEAHRNTIEAFRTDNANR